MLSVMAVGEPCGTAAADEVGLPAGADTPPGDEGEAPSAAAANGDISPMFMFGSSDANGLPNGDAPPRFMLLIASAASCGFAANGFCSSAGFISGFDPMFPMLLMLLMLVMLLMFAASSAAKSSIGGAPAAPDAAAVGDTCGSVTDGVACGELDACCMGVSAELLLVELDGELASALADAAAIARALSPGGGRAREATGSTTGDDRARPASFDASCARTSKSVK